MIIINQYLFKQCQYFETISKINSITSNTHSINHIIINAKTCFTQFFMYNNVKNILLHF